MAGMNLRHAAALALVGWYLMVPPPVVHSSVRDLDAVPIGNLNPDVLMMKPAEDRYRCDAAELLGASKIWSIFIQ